eukprot:jgi/Botrbrau1/13477/Bobra.0082s0074.1
MSTCPVPRLPYTCCFYRVPGGSEAGSPHVGQGRPVDESPAKRALSKVLALARSSDFAFASEELEADFQAYQARAMNLLSWFCASVVFTGYCVFICKFWFLTAEQLALLPPMLRPMVFQFVPTATSLALLAFFPGFYTTHKGAVHLLVQTAIFCAWHSSRQLVLWNLTIKGSTPGGSFTKTAQSFLDENLYFSAAWYAVPAFPVGQAGDLVITLAWLLANLVGNPAICASPLWPSNPVTLFPGPVGAVRRASTWLLAVATPLYRGRPDPVLTCPAMQAFWQVLGSWLTCLAVCIGEVLWRRAFLRTPAAKTRVGPHFAAAALQWPFGSFPLAWKCMSGLFLLTVGHCVVWAVALDMLSQ